jgi:hypothetical protein
VDDAPEALALIEREVMGLVTRLIGGGRRREGPAQEAATVEDSCPPVPLACQHLACQEGESRKEGPCVPIKRDYTRGLGSKSDD